MFSQTTIVANNAGVFLLAENDLESAAVQFQKALDSLRNVLRPASEKPTVHTTRNPTMVDTAVNAWLEDTMRIAVSDYGKKERERQPFLFSSGILLLACENAYSSDSSLDAAVTSSVIVFNIAVMCHRKCLDSTLKAKALYLQSYEILKQAGFALTRQRVHPLIDLLRMALFNNLACLSYEVSDYEASRNFFGMLVQAALAVQAPEGDYKSIGFLLESQKWNFLLNAVAMTKPKVASAA